MNNTPISGSKQIEPQVIVVRGPRVRAVAEYRNANDGVAAIGKDGRVVPVAMSVPLYDALTRQFDDDHHAVGYTLPDGFEPRRICKSALKSLAALTDEPVTLATLMVDLDRPKHKPWGADADPATIVRSRLAALPDSLAGWGWFVTRGGARLVRPLATPMPITPATASDVEARICGVLVALANAGTGTLTLTTSAGARVLAGTDEGDADFVLDAACCDWTRLFRLPRVVRDGVVQEWPSDFSEMRPIELADVMPVAKPAPAARANSTPKAAKLTTKPQKAKPASREMVADGDGDGGPASGDALHTGTADESAVTRARMYLDSVPPAIEGQSGDQHTFRACCAVVRGFDLNDDAAFEALSGWNSTCEPPWSESELRSKIAGARLYGGGAWGYLLNAAPARESASASSGDAAAADFGDAPKGSDLWGARRLVAEHGCDLRYVGSLKRWYAWDDELGRWIADDGTDEAQAMQRVWKLSDAITREALQVPADDESRRKAALSLAHRFASRSTQTHVVALARADARIRCRAEDWDASPRLLGVANGVVDLETGELRATRREDLISKNAHVPYDPMAAAPQFQRFLAEIMPDPEMRAFLQRALGYTITGQKDRDHAIFLAVGVGSNGKSTLLNAVAHALGDYAGVAPSSLLIRKGGDEHPTKFTTLIGKRLVTISELPEGGELNEEVAKMLAGGDKVTARGMGQDYIEFKPSHSLWISANYKPRVRDTDEGIWRRLYPIEFKARFVESDDESDLPKKDANLPEKLKSEAAGVLAWLIEGAQIYYREGLDRPREIAKAANEYRAAEDVLADFIADCIRTDVPELHFTPASAVHTAYQTWARENGAKAMTPKSLTEALRSRGFQYHRITRARGWRGLRLAGTEVATTEPSATTTAEPASEAASDGATRTPFNWGALSMPRRTTSRLRLSIDRRAAT